MMGWFRKEKPIYVKRRELDPVTLAEYRERMSAGQKALNGQPQTANRKRSTSSRIAVFGDIHANLEALEAVLADARAQGIAQFACTGDLVGYGPNPSECLDLVKGLGCPIVKGNHDEYAATDMSLKDFSLHAMNALIWTREQLSDAERVWLNALPMEIDLTTKYTKSTKEGFTTEDTEFTKDCITRNEASGAETSCASSLRGEAIHVVHSSVFEPEAWRYVIKQAEAEKVLPLQEQDLVFFGHTHVPSVYSFDPETGAFTSVVPATEGETVLESGRKWLMNPGSVGQPRDHDPRAAYLIFDPDAGTVEHRRVEYDFRKTAQKIVEAGLPERNAQRLYKGK